MRKRLPPGSRRFSFVFRVRKRPPKTFNSVGGKVAQLTIRFRDAKVRQIRTAARERRFSSPTALMRHAIERELDGEASGPEQRVAAMLEQIRRDQDRLSQVQQTMFAFIDTLAKAVLTALPEQSPPSVARARERYERFLKNAATALVDGLPPGLPNGDTRS